MNVVLIILGIVLVLVVIAVRLGRHKERVKTQAETIKDMEKYEEIDSEPFVDDPLDRM